MPGSDIGSDVSVNDGTTDIGYCEIMMGACDTGGGWCLSGPPTRQTITA